MEPEDLRSRSVGEPADNNVIPSEVVRQQRLKLSANSARANSDLVHSSVTNHHLYQHQAPKNSSITADQEIVNNSQPECQNGPQRANLNVQFDQDGLVLPKKVLKHPISAAQPIIRDLNRELKFNQVRGKNVLDQKSELKRAHEKLEESKRRREAEQERLNRRTSLEVRLEQRAEQMAKVEQNNNTGDNKRELC